MIWLEKSAKFNRPIQHKWSRTALLNIIFLFFTATRLGDTNTRNGRTNQVSKKVYKKELDFKGLTQLGPISPKGL